ncbi:hypothetical protein HWV62_10303, partial [Athelia sp. TMB]
MDSIPSNQYAQEKDSTSIRSVASAAMLANPGGPQNSASIRQTGVVVTPFKNLLGAAGSATMPEPAPQPGPGAGPVQLDPPGPKPQTLQSSKAVGDEADSEKDVENPLTKRHRMETTTNWTSYWQVAGYKWDASTEWLHKNIAEFAVRFLNFWVAYAVGHLGGMIKAITLRGWLTHLIKAILIYTHNENDERTGMQLLCREGLYRALEDEVVHLVDHYKLDRTRNQHIFFGRAEVQLMIQGAIADIINMVKLQVILFMLIQFYTGMRPSCLAASHIKYIEQGKYFKLGDITIMRTARMNFKMALKITNWKHHMSGTSGKTETFTLQSVGQGHNTIFCPCLWTIAFLWSRGAFGDIPLSSIWEDDSSWLSIIEEKRAEAFMLKAEIGGRKLTNLPGSAHKQSLGIRHLSISVGLVAGGSACLRREAGNYFSISQSKEIAANILGHTGQYNVLDRNYARTVESYDLTAMRLGEISAKSSNDVSTASLALHQLTRSVVTTLLYKANSTPASMSTQKSQKDEE